jgi:hypothetical protein
MILLKANAWIFYKKIHGVRKNCFQIAQRNLKWKVLHWVAFKSFFSILCLFFLFNTACLVSDLVSSRSTEGFSSKKMNGSVGKQFFLTP